MAHVQTVHGAIDPADLGWTLPHEHTQISLWQIPGRWDYWQLTRDQPLIVEELVAFREAGGGAIVDLTLPGIGRDPRWLREVGAATGLHVIMGCGWYRGAYYPAEARIDRRTVDDLADELVAEATDGVGASGVRPGLHRRDRHRQAVGVGARGARSPRGGPGRTTYRAGHHHPSGACRPSARQVGSSRQEPTQRVVIVSDCTVVDTVAYQRGDVIRFLACQPRRLGGRSTVECTGYHRPCPIAHPLPQKVHPKLP